MISTVIHTYNEEKNIERCLSSLLWVDEIVVIDMGSTDRTCEIASSFKARIFNHPYTGFVEPARNFGVEKAKGDWIVVVDADEEIPKSLANYLIAKAKDRTFDFYRIPRKNIIFGKWFKHTGWWPDYQVRFFKKGYVSWSDKIHGVPLTSGQGKDIDPVEDLSLLHHNYQTIEQFIERLNRYTTISAKQLYLENKHFSINELFSCSTREFINRFFVWEGYKDGLHGLLLSLLQSITEVVTYLKLWELENFKEEKISLVETEKLITKEYKLKQYWLVNELLKKPHSFLSDIVLRIKQKFNIYG